MSSSNTPGHGPGANPAQGAPSSTPDAPALRARLTEIDEEIAGLRARLIHLAAARKPIVESLKSVSYPVVTLPPEITAEIFLHYVDSPHIGGSGLGLPHPPREGGYGPLLLASICRAWRNVALALRPIWFCMHLDSGPDTISMTESLLEYWIPRAGSHPLDITLGSTMGTNLLCALVAPYSLQWESFSCALQTPITFPSELIRGRMPLLRKLQLSLSATEEAMAQPTMVTTFDDAPQLREVHLVDFTLQWISLPWVQLTTLNLTGQDPTQCVEMLHQTPNLETLTVDLPFPATAPVVPLRLAHLHTLKFYETQADLDLLDHLILPALAHLELAMLSTPVLPQLSAFLVRSACALQSISMLTTASRPALACLRLVPTVRVVRIRDAEWYDREFSQLFGILASEDAFLPNLQSLSFNPCTNSLEIPYAELADMLAARWLGRGNDSGSARLESFELVFAQHRRFREPIDVVEVENGLTKFRALMDDGLKINIRSLQKMSDEVDPWALCL
ncbi:hypothetical protein DFH09DRAFT_1436762 [Mycena vulgaris]|nr:hypothetical protein DFH09DRAFT_1436762 [Mycena vulgaris]